MFKDLKIIETVLEGKSSIMCRYKPSYPPPTKELHGVASFQVDRQPVLNDAKLR